MERLGRMIRKIIVWLLMFILCMVVVLILGILLLKLLLIVDIHHTEIDNWMEHIIKKENYFSGENWFSAIVTCVTAIPGIFCGVLAIFQTSRIHKIEARYHRPSLALKNAEMEAWWINEVENLNGRLSFEHYLNKIKEKNDTLVLMKIILEFEVRNEIEVKTFEIKEIRFKIAQDTFCLKIKKSVPTWQPSGRKQFRREYDGTSIICQAKCDVYPYKLKAKSPNKQKKTWDAVEKFMNYKGRLNDDYRHPETVIVAKIGYEFSKDKTEDIECRLLWDGDAGIGKDNQYHAIQTTNNGYFTYDIKK